MLLLMAGMVTMIACKTFPSVLADQLEAFIEAAGSDEGES